MTEARDKLDVMAKEINVRLGKAEKLDDRAEAARTDADDHRLAAALHLADARTIANENRIGWKRWVDKNIERSYRDVKKLVAIGSANDPVLALEGARKRDRDARARSREQEGGVIGDSAPGRAPGQQSASEAKPPPHNTEVDAIKAKLDRLSPADVQAIMSYTIRHLLDREAQRKLAKGLNAMVARMTTPIPETATPEGKKALLDGPMTEVEREEEPIPDFLRRPQPTEEEPHG